MRLAPSTIAIEESRKKIVNTHWGGVVEDLLSLLKITSMKLIETLMGGICLGGIAIKHFLKTEMRSMSRL